MTSIQKVFLLEVVIFSVTLTSCTKKAHLHPLGSNGGNLITFAVTESSSPTLGIYLVDKDGYTLYSFADDIQGYSNCSGDCAALWPYFYAGALTQANLGNGLLLSDFGTVRNGSATQTTYKGWPLYYYAPPVSDSYGGSSNVREAPGLTSGDGYNGFWFVAKPDYTMMVADGQLLGSNGVDYKSDYSPGSGKTVYFTDPNGKTLYNYSHDKTGVNSFTLADFSNNILWPIYEMNNINVPSTVDRSLFTTLTIFGHKQLVYKGWPLYTYSGDFIRGNNLGVSVGPTPGTWKVPGYATTPAL